METGRTSSVGLEVRRPAPSSSLPPNPTTNFLSITFPFNESHYLQILGFSPTGTPVVPTGHAAGAGDTTTGSTVAKREKIAWDEVCSKAAKVVSFIDLAGHER